MTVVVPGRVRSGLCRISQAAGRTATTLLDVLYPPHCLSCRTAIDSARGLCAQCWSSIRFIERPYCERLGTPFAHDLGPGLVSPDAIAHPPAFGRARAVACFDEGPVRNLVHQLKYADRPDYARVLGHWMARAGRDLLAEADVLVPVPLHRSRLWRRRYNQAALLAQSVGRVAGLPVSLQAVERGKATRSQVGMSRAARAANLQGAFRLTDNGAALRGARVVLVDDVLTTGATANAISRTLLRGGVAAVDLLVFAHVVTTP